MESNSLDEAHAYLDKVRSRQQSLRDDNERLQARVQQLEQELAQARTHKLGCSCECPGPRGVATSAVAAAGSAASSAAAAGASPGSIPAGVSQPIMDILFGSDTGPKAKSAAASTSPSSSPSKRATAAAASSHHLSPPRVRTRRGGTTSTASSPTSSMSDTDQVLAMLDSDSATSGSSAQRSTAARTSSTATAAGAGGTRKSKRKSGDAELDDTDDAAAAGNTTDEESVAAKTNKFIRVTSPSKRAHVDAAGAATAATEAVPLVAETDDDAAMMGGAAALDRQLSEAIQPSQDAFDREIFEQPEAEAGAGDAAAAGADDRSSPDFDYRTQAGAAASEVDTARALWSTRILPLDSTLLSRASHDADVHKRTGNDHFTSGDSKVPQALLSYSHAIKVLETALERCGIKGEADLKPWIELMVAESSPSSAEAAAAKETIALISELGSSLHPETSTPGLDPFSQMKILLRQLSSVYANRATAAAKMKPPQLLKAIGDVNYVITLQPFWFKGYGIKASILMQQRCMTEAVLFFEQALATPGISREEAAKLMERLEAAKSKIRRDQREKFKLTAAGAPGAGAGAGKDGGGSDRMSDCSSQTCGSLASTHMGATSTVGVKSSTTAAGIAAPNRSPMRSHSAAAGSSSSAAATSSHAVGAAAGSVAKPIELHGSGSGSGSYPRVLPSPPPPVLSEVPVHPPSLHTPVTPPSVVRQASDEQQQLFNLRQDSVEFVQQRQDCEAKQQQQRKKEQEEQRKKAEEEKKAAAAAAVQVKRETRSTPAAAAAAGGLHAPLSDASNRVSPTPRSHLAAPAPHSPARPSSSSAAAAAAGGSANKVSKALIHDLTQSPTKPRQSKGGSSAAAAAAGGRVRTSPSRSPARSPARDRAGGAAAPGSPAHPGSHEPVDWFQLPIITIEGVRDLLGDETFAESLSLVAERKVDKIKIQRHANPNEGLAVEEGLQERPRLLGLVYRTHVQPPSIGGRRGGARAAPESKENQHYTVSLRFDAENRCREFSCQCREEREQREDERDRSAAAAASAFANSPPPVHVKKEWTACKHAGAVLLVLRTKQEAQEKSKPLDLSAADRARRSMYVTPSRRKTIVEQKKEAALRAELELLPNTQLQALLAKNKQSKSGSKDVLIARIIENSTLGNLPRCSKCNTGSLFYAQGAYHCHGSFDPVSKRVLICDFKADRVDRSVWQE